MLVFCASAEDKRKDELEARGIRIEQVATDPSSGGRPDIHAILRRLGQLEITSVMIEGGATVNGTALAAGVVDKVFFYYAPHILADDNAIPFAPGSALQGMSRTLPVSRIQLHRFGEDFAVEGYLRDPYTD